MLAPFRRSGNAREEIAHAEDTRCATATCRRPVEAADCRQPERRRDVGGGIPASGAACRCWLAVTRGAFGQGTGPAAVPAAGIPGRGPSAAPRLADPASRVEEARRDPVPFVGRVPGGSSGRVRLQPVLRPLSRLAGPARPDHAPNSRGWREDVRRLRRRHPRRNRRPDRRGPCRPGVRRHPRRVELHLRRGHLDPGAARLDRIAHPRLHFLWRRAPPGGARQPQVGGHQGLPL